MNIHAHYKPLYISSRPLQIKKHEMTNFQVFWRTRTTALNLSRQRHDILDFSCCPLSRALHVTLANLQRFVFEFHLMSSPSAFSGSVDQLITSLLATLC